MLAFPQHVLLPAGSLNEQCGTMDVFSHALISLTGEEAIMTTVLRGVVIRLFLALLLILLFLVAAGVVTVQRSFPQVSGELILPGLEAPVDVYRDAYGVPHIYARTLHDLFMAQGYVHAQDRFWQMDFWRHIGSGRLSEMFGKSQVETDAFLRTLGWEQAAAEEWAQASPTLRLALQAYTDGVNAYLAEHKGSALSLEYAVLKLLAPDYTPEPWRPTDTLTWAHVMAWNLGGNMDLEIERALLLKAIGPERTADLFPPYPPDHPVIVPDFSARTGEAFLSAVLTESPALEAALQTLNERIQAVNALTGKVGSGLGSNNWVIAGSRTSTRMPILANDPHLSIQMPSIWYEVGLHCVEKTADCPVEVTGFSFAGTPGVIIGHNDRIAWGFTNVDPDVQDLYIERVNPDNPLQYEVNGEWVDMEVREETIRVAGGDPVTIQVRATRHGPIISDVYKGLAGFEKRAGVDVPSAYAIALRWTGLEPIRTLESILGLNLAQTWDEFRAAASLFDAPAQNMVYADVAGNIGYQMPGRVPIRKQGDGTLPVPGWVDDYEWVGYIPFEELPYTFNPERGYVVTANNAVVDERYPYLLAQEWAYGYRAQRIVEMIEQAPGPITLEYVQKMQGDNKILIAEDLVPLLMALPLQEARLIRARALLENWDYQMHMDAPAAALFAAFWKHLLAATFDDELPKDLRPGGGSRWFEVVRRLVQEPTSPWWDDQSTPEREDRDAILRRALTAAVAELEKTQGGDPQQWRWGRLHTSTFRNQTLGRSGVFFIEALFNRGPFPTSGGSNIVNATGWNPRQGYEVRSLPSMRMIVDLADLSRSLGIHTTGQSGHAFHPNYIDMADMWRNIQYHPMLWDRTQVEENAAHHLRMVP